ncbi:MAG: NADH-quinone oxidoreductase subunit L [Alphaproteobacteria bacterium]|nr:NADH-quinone oxidoreductase subunit L [Alphaproteobacteria bacterium]
MDYAAVFAPLAGAIIAGLLNRRLGDRGAQLITCAGVLIAATASIAIFKDVALEGNARLHQLFPWINSGDLTVNWAIKLDTLTAVMLVVVNGVSAMVHLYSVGYMSHDHSKPRFMAYLSLFTFFMLMLVTGDNLLQMFFGWEGVGLASYLLINFWYEKDSANKASIKAFLVNRVGDFGFVLGIFGCYMVFNSIEFATIFARAPEMADVSFMFLGHAVPALTTICLLLFVGAMGKSAQLGLHTWLPDAMEGPTPVSALIHAATMVTAGVFMVARLSPLFEYAPVALMVVTVVGALTAIVAATIGLTQFDIKRVIAYSTMSQLGYMFFALGVSAYSAGIFHLMTHAFFKALLFLGAGSVIHALSGEQDMRKMGGIWKKIPWTYALMWIGSLALAGVGIPGVFGMAGFYSKDMILEAAYADHSWFGETAYWLGVAAAFMTAFYSWRLLLLTFHGKPRMDRHTLDHAHESPWIMLGPLLPLAAGAVAAGYFGYELFVGHERGEFWRQAIRVLAPNDTLEAAHHAPEWAKILPVGIAVAGIVFAYLFYVVWPGLPAKIASGLGGIYRLVFNKYYFDEIYDFVFVRNANRLGRLFWKVGDDMIIDGLGPNGIAALVQRLAKRASALQTGYVYHYAFAMVIGLAVIMTWFWVRA